MSMMHHRTWFPFILVGLTVALLLVVIVFVDRRADRLALTPPEGYVTPIDAVDYPGDVSYILRNFGQTGDVEEARDRLLAQRVPTDYRDLHFELILIIDAYQRGETAEAEERMDAVRSEYSWLP